MNARCSGWRRSSVPSPSIVVMRPFATLATGVTHDRTGLPSTSTVQAPHCASPQPNFGPFSSRSFLRIYRSGVSGSTDTVLVSPFTLRVKFAMLPSVRLHGPVRRHQDLPAALAALRVRHGFLDVLDGIDRLDGCRQDTLRDLLAEVGVDRADLVERT